MIEESMDLSIKSMDRLSESIDKLVSVLEGGASVSGAATAKAPAAKPAADKKTAKSKFTADQVRGRFASAKDAGLVSTDDLKELIKDLGGADLAKLLLKPELFEEALTRLDALEEEAGGSGDDDL